MSLKGLALAGGKPNENLSHIRIHRGAAYGRPAYPVLGGNTGMIVVIFCQEKDENGVSQRVVSHGYDTNTGRLVVLPAVESPLEVGANFSEELGEWVID